jgi:hypothetical protein
MYCTSKIYQKLNAGYFKQIISLVLMLLCVLFINAQNVFIKGNVLNEKGEAVPFASVYIKGTKKGVQTNISGIFYLQNKSTSLIVICTALGYESAEKMLSKKDFIDSTATLTITLKTKPSMLEEVVVTGYSTSKKASYSVGSTVTISSAALSGKVSGVSISADKYLPVKVRGASSITSSAARDISIPDSEKSFLTATKTTQVKMLTAGELNDFKKWNMWEDYSKTDFKTYSEKWDLNFIQRYSVQLQNNNLKALVNQPVYLIDKIKGDTLWTAITDNTGKAELWDALNKDNNEVIIAVENEWKQFPAIPFTQGINQIKINKSCAVSNTVDIAFVVDATGSMQDEISYLKEELEDILTKIALKDAALDLNTGAVFYRDNGDAYVTKIKPLQHGIKKTIEFVKQQNADGGGDYPEALKEGLEDAIEKLAWSKEARTKIIFLLMDAPPHDEAKTAMVKLIKNAAAKGIRIVPVACSGTDKATEFIMRSIALATNGTYLFLTDDSGIGNAHIKPTTDEFKVELLNDLLQRIIEQMCFVQPCEEKILQQEPLTVYENTEKIKLFPNPTNGPITIESVDNLKEIFIADFTGKILMRSKINNQKTNVSIDLSGFPSGSYFVKYISKNNKMGAEKIILIR